MFTDPDMLILDEPTRGIDVGAKFEIYGIIQQLAAEGKGVIVISSELPELLGISDRIYTIFEGQITDDIPVGEATPEALMRSMTSTQKTSHAGLSDLTTQSPEKNRRRHPRPDQDVRQRPIHGRQFGILGALVIIIALFQILTGGKTLDPDNLINLVNQNAYVLILAIGMVMVIIAGHIDLSVGSVAAFVGIIVAKSMTEWHLPWPAAILLGLAIGAAVGAWQGCWVAYVGVPAFIVTLAGMLIFRGRTSSSATPTPSPSRPTSPSSAADSSPNGDPIPATTTPRLLLGLLIAAALAIVWKFVCAAPKPRLDSDKAPLWVSACQDRRALRRRAVRDDPFRRRPRRNLLPGLGHHPGRPHHHLLIRHPQHRFRPPRLRRRRQLARRRTLGCEDPAGQLPVMMNMSVLAALAGMLAVARSVSSGPQDGLGWELDAIAAVFIGGAAVAGGIGTVSRFHRRRSGHRCPQQRPAAARRDQRQSPDHQRPRAPHRSRHRRVLKAPRRPLADRQDAQPRQNFAGPHPWPGPSSAHPHR